MEDTNPNLILESDSGLILEKNEANDRGIPLYYAHWRIFIPSLVILIAYAFAWGLLSITNNSDSNLARLFIVVMSVFVPLLAAYAFLKYQTIRLQVNEDSLYCHPGWPKDMATEVHFPMIEEVNVKQGLTGRIFGGGSIVLLLADNTEMEIRALSSPFEARKDIIKQMALHQIQSCHAGAIETTFQMLELPEPNTV
jgi:membrane protein YdbS with pleckstrin-like domain